MQKIFIEIKGLTKTFHQQSHALKRINLTVYQADIYGLIGTSGAGKSTLMRCLSGLDCPTEGSIRIEGREMATKDKKELSEIRQQMGMVFQQFCLFSSRTVAGNIAYPLEIQGVPPQNRKSAFPSY